jgi:ABC-type transporter Mla maintaining outer membrane lipid asymmetry ATPase subunit MlaF
VWTAETPRKSVLTTYALGLLEPHHEEIVITGRSMNKMSRSEVIGLRRDIGVMFQDGVLFSSMTVYANVTFPLRQHCETTTARSARSRWSTLTRSGSRTRRAGTRTSSQAG